MCNRFNLDCKSVVRAYMAGQPLFRVDCEQKRFCGRALTSSLSFLSGTRGVLLFPSTRLDARGTEGVQNCAYMPRVIILSKQPVLTVLYKWES